MRQSIKAAQVGSSILYYLGNSLMICSFAFILYVLYPIVMVYLFPPNIVSLNSLKNEKGFYLSIPKIYAQSKVIAGVDPFNSAAYHKALTMGVAQASGTSLPGQVGTIYLFAHSSGPPWEQTYMNTIFVRLSELKKGDMVYLVRRGKVYKYEVQYDKVIWPNDLTYLLNTKKTQLILQTCTPIGTDYQRLLVFAKPV